MTGDGKSEITLDDLTPGQRAIIQAISADGPLGQRLMSLGLLAGTEISLSRRALGGDPIEVELMGYSLSLRRNEARKVQVCLTAAD